MMREGKEFDFIGSQKMQDNMHNGKYEDPSFPADDSSLQWAMQKGTGDDYDDYWTGVKSKKIFGKEGIVWLRATEVDIKLTPA